MLLLLLLLLFSLECVLQRNMQHQFPKECAFSNYSCEVEQYGVALWALVAPSVILVLGKFRQEDHEFWASLGYTAGKKAKEESNGKKEEGGSGL